MGSFAEWLRDVRLALRSLRRSRGFAAVTMGTLGLAIGANAAIYSVVHRVVIDPLPFRTPDRLVYIAATAPGSNLPGEFGVSDEFYLLYRERSRLLDDVATFNGGTSTLRVGQRVERVPMSWPAYTLFSTLGARAVLGRLPAAGDGNTTAVLSWQCWKAWFGGDSSVIGKSYYMSGEFRTVIGVTAPSFHFPSDGTLLWIPQEITAGGVTPGRFGDQMVARMKPGVTPEQLALELTTLAKQLPERFGGSAQYAKTISAVRMVARPLRDQLLGSAARALWVLFGAVTIVLLIACANVANLFLVRAEGRHREMAVRTALGAGRARLVRLQLAEAAVVAAGAGVLAVVMSAIVLPVMVHASPPVPRLADVHLDVATVMYTAAAAVVAALACGLWPAVRASAPDLLRLREGGRGATHSRHWLRDGLVVGQTALALVLLIGSGLLLRSYDKLSHVNPGYSTTNIFTFQFAPDHAQLKDGPTWTAFHLAFMDRLRALAGVQSVGIVDNVPLDEGLSTMRFRTEAQAGDPGAGTPLSATVAAGDYFRTMGIKVLAGRPFNREDNTTALGNVVVSRSAANRLWPGENPVGRRVLMENDSTWQTVIGVVGEVQQEDWRGQAPAIVYLPLQSPQPGGWFVSSPGYVVKTARAETIAPEIRALVHEVAPEAPMYRTYTMQFLAKRSMRQLSFTMLTLGVAATLALILGAVGLFGVLSYIVAERTREIGVRMALGAEAGRVRRMVVVQGARVVGIGAVIGLVVALASTRVLSGLLYGVPAVDEWTFVAMTAAMMLIGLVSSYVPARRASNVDPMESLRSE